MADGSVTLNNNTSVGAKTDTSTVSRDAVTYHRARVVLAGEGESEIAEVLDDTPATDAQGLVVRPVAGKASTATLANVSSSATSVTLAASNADRIGLTVFNDSTQVLYLKFGATASSSSYTVKLTAGQFYEMPQPIYPGTVSGIWASANGAARVMELA